jgi:hypothetical protein
MGSGAARTFGTDQNALERPVSKFNHSVSRRAFMQGLGLAGLAAVGAGRFGTSEAFAAPADGTIALFGEQAEWVQKYDADPRLTVQRNSTPILSQQTIAETERAIAQYQDLVARGGWNTVPNQTMKLGSKGNAIVALRQRLVVTGDLDEVAGNSPIFDSYVESSVKRFQSRHGINATGVVAQQTVQALNVPVQVRVRQLEINLVRLRSFAGNLGVRFVTMNSPGAAVETVEGGQVATHHAAGVGKIDRQSPVMQAKAVEVNFNPFWTVPVSIIRKDLIPKMQADSNYLSDNKIRVYNGAGVEVAPNAINWNTPKTSRGISPPITSHPLFRWIDTDHFSHMLASVGNSSIYSRGFAGCFGFCNVPKSQLKCFFASLLVTFNSND